MAAIRALHLLLSEYADARERKEFDAKANFVNGLERILSQNLYVVREIRTAFRELASFYGDRTKGICGLANIIFRFYLIKYRHVYGVYANSVYGAYGIPDCGLYSLGKDRPKPPFDNEPKRSYVVFPVILEPNVPKRALVAMWPNQPTESF